MDQEGKYWLTIWSLVASVVITLIVGAFIYGANSDRLIKEMVDKGANPLDAACAMSPGERRCIVRYSIK